MIYRHFNLQFQVRRKLNYNNYRQNKKIYANEFYHHNIFNNQIKNLLRFIN